MLNPDENEILTRVGPGTPCGDLLRRYWYPIAMTHDLSPDQPTRFVRVLGEDLVLFRDKRGNVGLLADHCSHRGASLLYGRVEERGIACAYHGWLYDTQGNCPETPAEPSESLFHLTVKQRAYPVKKLAGLYWAYLGPQPAPELPLYDVLARRDGRQTVQLRAKVDCNYLQAMENSVDPAHLQILHQSMAGRGRPVTNTTRGFTDDVATIDFYLTGDGIMKKRTYTDGTVDEHPLIFPNILRQGNGIEIRTPLDDTHLWIYEVRFIPNEPGALTPEDAEPEVVPARPHKEPMGVRHPRTRHFMDGVDAQDYMAWETQGPVADRSTERLASTDRGVVMLRNLIKENIEKVLRGEDPIGVIRDPNRGMIDTNLDHSLVAEAGLYPATPIQASTW